MAPITAARSTLADGCTTMTNASSANAASATATRGPDQCGGEQHRPADDGHVGARHRGQVRQARRRGTPPPSDASSVDVSPSTSAGSIAAWSAGSAARAASAKPVRTPCAARWTGDASPNVGSPVADRHRDGEVAPGRPGDAGAEARRPARGQLGEAHGRVRKRLPAQTFRCRRSLQRSRGTSSGRRPASVGSRSAVTTTVATEP